MPRIKLYLEDGREKCLYAPAGVRLLEVVDGHTAGLETVCGGAGRCGKCRVMANGELSAPDAEERTALGAALQQGVRLACRTFLMGDVEVRLCSGAELECIRTEGAMPDFAWDPLFKRYGVAVDIGTTTLAAQLYSREGLLSQASARNPQHIFGADVISRIEKALAGAGGELTRCARGGVAQLLQALARKGGISTEEIDAVVLTGNTAMLYLLTGQTMEGLSRAPFQAEELFGAWLPCESLKLPCAKGAPAYLPRCISAFLGADIVTALLASGICGRRETALLADIGTNGEIALWHDGGLLCCSTAAGPVFEGAGLSCGMQGAPGAIDHVKWTDGALTIHTVGERPAQGICGSGIIDIVAALLRAGLLDETGRFRNDRKAFSLTPGIEVTQKDIRMVQLAKGAVCAGIRSLLEVAGVPGKRSPLAVAGGFGSYLDLHSAAVVGLYPAELEGGAGILGTAALTGAAMLLLQRRYLEEAAVLAQRAKTIELSSNPVFMEHYIDAMGFDLETSG